MAFKILRFIDVKGLAKTLLRCMHGNLETSLVLMKTVFFSIKASLFSSEELSHHYRFNILEIVFVLLKKSSEEKMRPGNSWQLKHNSVSKEIRASK